MDDTTYDHILNKLITDYPFVSTDLLMQLLNQAIYEIDISNVKRANRTAKLTTK